MRSPRRADGRRLHQPTRRDKNRNKSAPKGSNRSAQRRPTHGPLKAVTGGVKTDHFSLKVANYVDFGRHPSSPPPENRADTSVGVYESVLPTHKANRGGSVFTFACIFSLSRTEGFRPAVETSISRSSPFSWGHHGARLSFAGTHHHQWWRLILKNIATFNGVYLFSPSEGCRGVNLPKYVKSHLRTTRQGGVPFRCRKAQAGLCSESRCKNN